MPAGYRDSLEALRAQLASREADLAPLEARLSRAPWSAIAPAWGVPVAPPPPPPPPAADEPNEFDALEQRRHAVEARRALLAAFFARVPDERAAHTTAPPLAPPMDTGFGRSRPLQMSGMRPDAATIDEWCAAFHRALERLAPGVALAPLVVDGPEWGASFRRGSTPFTAEFRVRFETSDRGYDLALTVTTGVALAAGPVRITPQGMGDELLQMVGLRRDIEFGEAEFDGMFFVRGDEPAARAALVPAARRALLAIAREDVPRVAVEQGAARVGWSYPPSMASITAAVTALEAIRAAPVVWPRG